jgi:hypothetical protein
MNTESKDNKPIEPAEILDYINSEAFKKMKEEFPVIVVDKEEN